MTGGFVGFCTFPLQFELFHYMSRKMSLKPSLTLNDTSGGVA